MSLIVAKFGGTSVADTARIKIAAGKIAREIKLGHKVAVVVSAMSGVTNQLVGYCDEMGTSYDAREYDTVVSSGEQITAGLMAMALQALDVPARSWLGWQIPIKTDETHAKARVEEIDTKEILKRMNEGEVVVVPGFQGVTEKNRISTLGRGGSDTSAVALAAALNADRCDIYTDVDGVYTTDPRVVPEARKIKKISHEEMIELASLGAKVLQTRSVQITMRHQVPLQVLSSFNDEIGSDLPGTLVTREEEIMEQQLVNGIAFKRDEAKITLLDVPDTPGIASKVFKALSGVSVNVDMIVQNVSVDGKVTDITFTTSTAEVDKAVATLQAAKELEGVKIQATKGVAKVSVVGIGMISHHGVATTMFETLASKNINIQVISTSEIKISVLIDQDFTELAVRSLHAAFGLDDEKDEDAA